MTYQKCKKNEKKNALSWKWFWQICLLNSTRFLSLLLFLFLSHEWMNEGLLTFFEAVLDSITCYESVFFFFFLAARHRCFCLSVCLGFSSIFSIKMAMFMQLESCLQIFIAVYVFYLYVFFIMVPGTQSGIQFLSFMPVMGIYKFCMFLVFFICLFAPTPFFFTPSFFF